jgi:hypothetical protein
MDKLLPDTIPPEGLRVAEAYLACGGDSKAAASELGMPISVIDAQLKKGEVKAYINRAYNESGFRNKFRIGAILDSIINMKLDEMQETELGSSMDIMDILKIAHKMKMDEAKAEIELEKVRAANQGPVSQTNIQNNIGVGDPSDAGYQALLSKLTGGK